MQPAPNGVTVHSADVSQAATPLRPESTILRRLPVPLIFLIAFGLSFTFIYRAAGPIPLFAQWNRTDFFDLDDEASLARVLKASAMEDNTVILTTLNAAWASKGTIIDLFLESFRIGNDTRSLLNHLVIIAFDKKAYLRCRAIHSHCFALATPGVDFSVQENFMTEGYLKMMWRRIDFLRIVLEMGYNFIFTEQTPAAELYQSGIIITYSLNQLGECHWSAANVTFACRFNSKLRAVNESSQDADIMWFRNPFSRFFPDGDFQIACDQFNGNSHDRNNRPNGGFNYVKSSNRTIKFYKFWYSSRVKHPKSHDQDVLNAIKYDQFIDKIGLKMRFLSTDFFGGICQPSKDFDVVCTMHANCCVGLNRKINDLSVMLEDWKSYMALPTASKTAKMPVWRVPQKCSLKPLD